jgi:hypothetical protein
MREKINLEDHLKKREKKMNKLIEEVNFFKKIKLPLKMHVYHDNSFQLFSEDYAKAEYFEFDKRNEDLGGYTSHYDGGYYTTQSDLYPQFYFNLKKGSKLIPVFIRHEGFEKDKNVVLNSKKETFGTKDYSDHSKIIHNRVNYKKTISFFEEKGVPKNLIKKLTKDFEKLEKVL